MDSRKKLSGAQNRKRKAAKDAMAKKQSASMLEFVKTSRKNTDSIEAISATDANEACPSTSYSQEKEEVSQAEGSYTTEEVLVNINEHLQDPAKWPKNINDKLRVTLVETGPFQIKNEKYPLDLDKRHFSDTYYNRKMVNGEVVPRSWLVYSKMSNSVFCFCCKLFPSPSVESSLVKGYNDWGNLSKSLQRHETSSTHIKNFLKWKEFDKNLKNKSTVDSQAQAIYEMEKKQSLKALERIIEIIKFLGAQNLAFRGSSDKLYEKNNGNFLKLIELFAKFDPIIESHIHKALQQNKSVHYLSKDSQNEILSILGNAIRDKILSLLRQCKYYAIILDCTPDASKTEQMSVIVRFVSCGNGKVTIREHFLGFIDIRDSTGRGLCEIITNQLSAWNLSIENMRGQGYDNGANMKGKENGLQNLIMSKNPRAFFVPCAAHTLNLTINDAAKINLHTVSFFSIVQEIYNFFSSSTKRWTVLLKFVNGLTLKQPSDTRWESRINAIRPLRYQLGEIYDALYEILNDSNFNKDVQHEAKCLCNKLKDFKFICSLIIWHDLLNRINPVSKALQEKSVNISLVLKSIENLKLFLLDYRKDSNYEIVLGVAKELSKDVDGEAEFKSVGEVRQRKKTRQFQYEHADEPPQTEEQKFRVNVFYALIDTAWNSLDERFHYLKKYNDNFDFLYNLSNWTKDDLKQKCFNLEMVLNVNNDKDIEATELFDEICAYQDVFGETNVNNGDPLDILNFILSNNLSFPNFEIILRILLTIPVSVASGERSFSKLKLIKNYLRTTMSQERLVNLAMISIENDVSDELEIPDIMNKFINIKLRKIKF